MTELVFGFVPVGLCNETLQRDSETQRRHCQLHRQPVASPNVYGGPVRVCPELPLAYTWPSALDLYVLGRIWSVMFRDVIEDPK